MQKGLPVRRSPRTPTSKINYASTKGKERTRSELGPGSGKWSASMGKIKQLERGNKLDRPKEKTKGKDEVMHTACMEVNLHYVGNNMCSTGMVNSARHNKVGVENDSEILPTLRISPVPMGLSMSLQEYLATICFFKLYRQEPHVDWGPGSLLDGTPVPRTVFDSISTTTSTASLGAMRRITTAALTGTTTPPPATAVQRTWPGHRPVLRPHTSR